jgi:hypothetical protein
MPSSSMQRQEPAESLRPFCGTYSPQRPNRRALACLRSPTDRWLGCGRTQGPQADSAAMLGQKFGLPASAFICKFFHLFRRVMQAVSEDWAGRRLDCLRILLLVLPLVLPHQRSVAAALSLHHRLLELSSSTAPTKLARSHMPADCGKRRTCTFIKRSRPYHAEQDSVQLASNQANCE